jgi:very-short-patch-repair endonuclease
LKIPASKQNNFHYNTKLKEKARYLRNNMTKSEACMWKFLLKKKAMNGYTFLRQRPVLYYIADFMCQELMLILECDGITHHDEAVMLKDQYRQKELESIGFTVLRFSDWEILNKMGDVSVQINSYIEEYEKKK